MFDFVLEGLDPDCFSHVWYDPSNAGGSYSKSDHASDCVVEKGTIEDLREMYYEEVRHEPERNPFYPKPSDQHFRQEPGCPIDIQFSMFYGMMQSISMMKDSGEDYDLVIRSRYDYAPMSHLPDEIDGDKLYFCDFIPPRDGTHVLCDYMMFGSKDVMVEVGDTFNHIPEYHNSGTKMCGEEMLMRHMRECGIQTVPVPAYGILVRDGELNNTNFGKPSPKRI